MASVATGDRTATEAEVIAVRQQLRDAAERHGLTQPRVDEIGTLIVGSHEPGYGQIRRFAAEAATIAGVWVNVIADDVDAAQVSTTSL